MRFFAQGFYDSRLMSDGETCEQRTPVQGFVSAGCASWEENPSRCLFTNHFSKEDIIGDYAARIRDFHYLRRGI